MVAKSENICGISAKNNAIISWINVKISLKKWKLNKTAIYFAENTEFLQTNANSNSYESKGR